MSSVLQDVPSVPTPPKSPLSVFSNMGDHVKQLWDRITTSS